MSFALHVGFDLKRTIYHHPSTFFGMSDTRRERCNGKALYLTGANVLFRSFWHFEKALIEILPLRRSHIVNPFHASTSFFCSNSL